MNKLLGTLGGRKWLVTVVGMLIIALMIFNDIDTNMIKWFAGIVIGFNVGQGIADGLSQGRTSTKKE